MRYQRPNPNLTKCPVCGADLKGNLCGECGYLLLVFPAEMPGEIASMLDKQKEIMTAKIREHKAEIEKIKEEALADKTNAQKEALKALAADETIGKQAEENRELKSRLSAIKEESERKQNDLQKQNRDLASDLKTLRSDCERQTRSFTAEIERLKASLLQAESKPSGPEVKGIVLMRDMETDKYSAFPVFAGTRTYGTSPESGSHVHIYAPNPFVTLKPRHFTVSHSSKGFSLEIDGKSARYMREGDQYMVEKGLALFILPLTKN